MQSHCWAQKRGEELETRAKTIVESLRGEGRGLDESFEREEPSEDNGGWKERIGQVLPCMKLGIRRNKKYEKFFNNSD